MNYIFRGLFFTTLNFDFTSGSIKIGLIPSFIGYILMLKGIDELSKESEAFTKIRIYAKGMAIYSTLTYIIDLIGMSYIIPSGLDVIIGIGANIVAFYITYNIIMGIADIEKRYELDLNSHGLYSIWMGSLILTGLMYLTLLVLPLALAAVILNIIVSIYFLVAFNRSKNVYDEAMNKNKLR